MAKKKDLGHSAHSKKADNVLGLEGVMPRPIKITMLGAGSGFTPHLFNDIMSIPGMRKLEFCLVDIDKKRLDVMYKLTKRMAHDFGLEDKVEIKATTNRIDVLPDSDYIICCVEVSGTSCVRFDNDIPLKYGIDQCIGDTIGPGGLFKGLRTIPVWLDILEDCEELCPNAVVLNYTNPMNMMCLAAGRTSTMQVVGLCHSVQGTSHWLSELAKVPYEEMEWECAGINHLAWFTKLEHKGKDLYPRLLKQWEKETRERKVTTHTEDAWDLVRKDMAVHFGAFITESSGHLSEYVPYYRKRKELLKHYCVEGYGGGSSFYANNWPTWRKNHDAERLRELKQKEPLVQPQRTWEYASWIIEAIEKNKPFKIHGNVMNNYYGGRLISNLPEDGCVEVPCLIDSNGVQPTCYGDLPPQMAAICAADMRMFDLAADAAIYKSVELATYALMLDPLTSAICSPAEIKKMTLELFKAEKKFLQGYK